MCIERRYVISQEALLPRPEGDSFTCLMNNALSVAVNFLSHFYLYWWNLERTCQPYVTGFCCCYYTQLRLICCIIECFTSDVDCMKRTDRACFTTRSADDALCLASFIYSWGGDSVETASYSFGPHGKQPTRCKRLEARSNNGRTLVAIGTAY